MQAFSIKALISRPLLIAEIGCIVFLASWVYASEGQATVITFDEPGLVPGFATGFPGETRTPPGTVLSDQLVSLGVIFSIDDHGVGYVSTPAFLGGLAGPSGGNVAGIDSFPLRTATVDDPPTTFAVLFVDPSGSGRQATTPASNFSVFVSDANFADLSVIVRTFGLDGGLLEEQFLNSLGEVLSFSIGDIARVEFFDLGSDGHTIDDLSFGPLTVVAAPEPPALGLLSLGLMGLAAVATGSSTCARAERAKVQSRPPRCP